MYIEDLNYRLPIPWLNPLFGRDPYIIHIGEHYMSGQEPPYHRTEEGFVFDKKNFISESTRKKLQQTKSYSMQKLEHILQNQHYI